MSPFKGLVQGHPFSILTSSLDSIFRSRFLTYLHFDPAVHRLEDLGVVDGMDLDQQGQTLGY